MKPVSERPLLLLPLRKHAFTFQILGGKIRDAVIQILETGGRVPFLGIFAPKGKY